MNLKTIAPLIEQEKLQVLALKWATIQALQSMERMKYNEVFLCLGCNDYDFTRHCHTVQVLLPCKIFKPNQTQTN